ncbi:ejaculatory bulb-specific protein 3-like [Vespula maculifrons]|uniref:Ejaculatory bulb-specific protein 3-like n=1 Tax=Vespula maculifrons TaxID=7453 RepID=A0ABD2CHM4_VESMC
MKFTYIFFFIIGMFWLIEGYTEEPYSNIYDQVDVDAIFNSERFLNQYINCLLDDGPCTADGRSLKQVLPEILATQCARCNEYQKKIAKKIWQLKERKPKHSREMSGLNLNALRVLSSVFIPAAYTCMLISRLSMGTRSSGYWLIFFEGHT